MSAQISLPQRLLPDHALKMAPSQFLLSKLLLFFSHWRRKWQPTPVLLPGKSHGWRSLVGCRLWGHTESETTEQLHFHFSLSCIGEGNGNPLSPLLCHYFCYSLKWVYDNEMLTTGDTLNYSYGGLGEQISDLNSLRAIRA